MILPDCRIVNHENEISDFAGMDNLQHCRDPRHFESYPYLIKYEYNSRGFRGPEWPADVHNAVWCLGDSFTVGLGAPLEHTWPHVLSQAIVKPCINVSMDGASNDWISRWAQIIIQTVNPQHMVVHWSFTHRRELPPQQIKDKIWTDFYNSVKDPNWPECSSKNNVYQLPSDIRQQLQQDHRFDCYTQGFDLESLGRLHSVPSTPQQDAEQTLDAIAALEQNKSSCKIVHSHIPNWHHDVLEPTRGQWIRQVRPVDLARDGFHYGKQTVHQLVNAILEIFEI